MILVAQVSDTHFDLGARNAERAARVLAHLSELRLPPAAIVHTGDITDAGKPEQYAQAARALRTELPLFVAAGNHDDRAALRADLLGTHPSDAPLNQAHRVGELTVVLLDSSVPGEPAGRLSVATYDWLRATLADGDGPVLLALHHPPVRVHSPIVDSIALADPAPLAAIVAGSGRIAGVLTGHAHSPISTLFAGKPLVVGPSTASVLRGAWELDAPDHVMDYAPDPGYALHLIDRAEDGGYRLVTHFRTVPAGGRISVQPD
ncbi:metallophosphoesterase [Nocardia harenae]|uniref:metallophosphoesterase n=1 Tax=Nocardia harenae TaxID=358707 RepID=UPI00082B1754|nr:metallophosphoesterase [Nocardia harenae]